MEEVNWAIVIPLIVILLGGQGLWIFQDARKRGEKYYWLWGLFGLIQFPTSLIIYFLVTRSFGKSEEEKDKDKDKRCSECHREIKDDWYYCPYCSNRLK